MGVPFPPVTDGASALFVFHNADGKPNRVNTLHFAAATSGSTLAELATVLNANLTSDMWGLMSNADTCTDVLLTDLRSGGGQSNLHLGTPIVGEGSGHYLPNSCGLIKLTTDTRGRSYRGRVYIPDLAESFTVNGLITPGNQASTSAAWVLFANALVSDGKWALAVCTRYENNVRRNPGRVTQVTNAACESRVATQRRRQLA